MLHSRRARRNRKREVWGAVAASVFVLAVVGGADAEEPGVAPGTSVAEDEFELDPEDEELFPDDPLPEMQGADPDGDPSLDEIERDAERETPQRSRREIDSDVDEILVRGEAALAIDVVVPTSAVEFDAETLEAERIQDIRDLSNFTPNLQINTAFAATNPVIFIRGVGLDDFNANSASAVAIYQDGIYMNSPAGQLFQFFDVKGAQVLRGPQAGPYRNAGAGAILIESNPPTHDFESYAQFTYGNYDLVELEGAINLPIVPDLLASRTSGTLQRRDGYVKNRCAGKELTRPNVRDPQCLEPRFPGFSLGFPTKLHDRVNDADNWALRSQLLLDLSLGDSAMAWLVNVHGGQNDSLATQYQHRGFRRRSALGAFRRGRDSSGYEDTDNDPFEGDYNSEGDEDLDLFGASLKGSWDVADGQVISSISGYEWHDRRTFQNTDANPRPLLNVLFTDDAWQFSQDLRLESDWTDAFRTMIGGYFLMEDLDSFNIIDQQGGPGRILTQDYEQKTRSYSLYGGLSWIDPTGWVQHLLGTDAELPRRFSLDGDVRYTSEYKDFTNESALLRPTPPDCNLARGGLLVPFNQVIACQNGITSGQKDHTFRGVAGGVSVTFDVMGDESLSVYAKYTRGWKPGHFNGGAFLSAQLIEPVDPETIDAVEVGARTSWFDGLLTVDGAAFYYDFQDMQVFQLETDENVGPIPQLINAQGATIKGVELDLHAIPFEGLDLRYNVAYLDTEYSDFETVIRTPIPQRPDETGPPEFVENRAVYTGNRMVGSPEWSMAGSLQYTLPLDVLFGRDAGELVPRFSFSYRDDVFFDVAEGRGVRSGNPLPGLPDATIGQGAHWLVHASLAWRLPGQSIEVRGWVRNLLAEEYRVQSFDATDIAFRAVLDAYGPPRTYGITTDFRF